MTRTSPIQTIFAATARILPCLRWHPIDAFQEPWPRDYCRLLLPTEKAYFMLYSQYSSRRLPMRGAVFPEPPRKTVDYQWWIMPDMMQREWQWIGYATEPYHLRRIFGGRVSL